MLGPALCAPALAWGLSARPAAEASPSGALLVFAAAAAFIGLIAAAALAALPRSLSNAAPSEVLSTPPPSEGEGGGVIRGEGALLDAGPLLRAGQAQPRALLAQPRALLAFFRGRRRGRVAGRPRVGPEAEASPPPREVQAVEVQEA
mmetsp:Transcript_22505/g.74613  ORF Transcript_22505/g.74613 Transcript_22505/m.74613 type:complete len:147 (+) Transcript_22505:152-592(+)